MGQPNDDNFPSSHQENEEKLQASTLQEDKSKEDRFGDFQKYYVDDYIADQEGRLENKKNRAVISKSIHIHFNFQESSFIPKIHISQPLHLQNLGQFEGILNHYYDQSNAHNPIKNHLKYKDLQSKIERRKTSQSNIDQRINELSKYLTFTFEDYYILDITYTNINRSTIPLAIGHLQSILLIFKIGSYLTFDNDEVDILMREVFKQCKDKLPYKPFGNHYVDSLLYIQPESPVIMLKLNLNFKLNNMRHSLKTTLNIRNIDQFKAILRSYSNTQQIFIQQSFNSFKPSSRYKDLYIDITYRNTLQLRMDKVLKRLNNLLNFNIKEDEYDPLTLNGYYYSNCNKDLPIPLIIKHLELITLTFKTWNDDENDRDAMDLYLSVVKDRFIPLFYESFKYLGSYYIHLNYLSKYQEDSISNTLHLNLHIILKQYQRIITKTLQLQESIDFINLLYYHNFLPNGYLSSSKSFDTSFSNLLYIFEWNEYNLYILNLYYYSLSNELNTSLIIRHLELMISSFNINPTDITTLSQYLSSITNELNSLPKPSLSTSSSPTTSFQYHFITQYQDKLAKPLLTTNLNIHLRLLLKNSQSISNTYPLHLSSINQLLSLLQHYSLSKDPLDPSWIEAYREHADLYKEITYRNRLQTSYDRVLSKLSKRISFHVEKDPKDISNLSIDYIDLTGSDVPYAIKHLDTMMIVYKAGNTSYKDKLEVDNFVFLMREDVEEGFTSRLNPNISDRLDRVVSNLGKDQKDPVGTLNNKLDTVITSLDSLSLRLGTNDRREKDNLSVDNNPLPLTGVAPSIPSLPRDINAMDGRLGGASTDIPNLLEVSGNDISMMEDVD